MESTCGIEIHVWSAGPAEAVRPFSQYAGKWLSEHLFLQNFQGGACPLTPLEQACITAGPLPLCFRRAWSVNCGPHSQFKGE